MLKRKVDEYLNNWFLNRKQALLIKGARQIGKTFSINQFGTHSFENVIEINFVLNPSLIQSFYAIKDYKQLMLRISTLSGNKLIPGKTLIFFDEIQVLYERREEEKRNRTLDSSSSDLITVMKEAVIVGEYRFILSGSLLGITLNNVKSFPVGYLDEYQMYPLDFEEFLGAKGVGKDIIKYANECFNNKEKVDEEVNRLLLEDFKEYVLVGGMPEVLETYFNTNNLYLVDEVQKQIINNYKSDITTYIHDEEKKIRVRDIYNSIPSELNAKNKRFISSHVIDKDYLKNYNLQDEFIWLTNAGVAIPVYNVTDPVIPLVLSSNRKTLKLFVNDIGLLGSMLLSTGIKEKMLNNELVINYGAPFENVIAQELFSHGFNESLFYYNSKTNGEVDFIIEYNNDILPIEVKSGKPNELNYYNHYTLNKLISNYDIPQAFVFGMTNVTKESNVIYNFPLYMISFLKK